MVATHHLAAPIPTELPDLESDEYFSEVQWQVLYALVDAVIPSIVAEPSAIDRNAQLCISQSQYDEAYEHTERSLKFPPDPQKFRQYMEASPLDNLRFTRLLKRTIQGVPLTNRRQLGRILNIIATRPGSLAATGYYTPLHEQPVHVRESIIQAWNQSWVSAWPFLAKTITKLARVCFAKTDPLLHEISDYRDVVDNYRPGPSFDFNFMQFEAGAEPETVETDVVIVGSGCGGAVCAKVLAEAGHRVIVVDKGYYFPPSRLPMTVEAAHEYLYEGGPALTADGSTNVIAGSCWGGGGTVNWSVCLQPQGYLRQEWANEGLGFFTTQEFQNCLDRVCDFMGVSDAHIRHNHGAKVILEGATKLGWSAKPCPQNTGGAEHYCGRCSLGCGSGEKRGTAVSWLPAAGKAGAKFIEGFRASEILFEGAGGSKKAVGVLGAWTSRDEEGNVQKPESERTQRQLRIKAKKVIVACGTFHSPLLLMRSGLKNPHIGKNLHIHPVSHLNATFDKDIKGWEGSILTSVCTSFENLDGKGHGVKLEPSSMIPDMFLFEHPWRSALQYKLDALRCRQMNTYISIARDRDTGRVYPDPDDGRPIIDYHPSAFDRKHILAGIIALAKMCYIQGATEIWPFVHSVPSFVRRSKPTGPTTERGEDDDIDQGINDPDFVAWIDKLERTGLSAPDATFTSAHQMGTNRMSAHPSRGVVDPEGRVWEAQNLYVGDASVFPSASGVNPMITNMAIADWIARGISRDLKKDDRLRAAL
ncbi:long-chain fatty alcohol dehydrogenase [Annulohypoxylon truncatum]|uniref:long-chain fatty alcohol dehydrogenase n=1 Tax=Annulohypoxylon truncatum TaxID=327061 RepID=UPI002007C5B3|nr:long-chain fatty alcohol dehydrogenase [Annulohypoxylon truncatum]KAI1212866.1 long-chain fatty alcohol dehydrogenase [Annulohypoxylon truncatum]